MRSRMPKILLPLGGKPVLLRTLEAFHGVRGIGEIILALPSSRISATLKEHGSRLMKLGLIKVVPGGPTRRESVGNALSVVDRAAQIVVVHDAARPLVTPGEIRAVLKEARRTGAAVLAVPVRDTLKAVDGKGRIVKTVDRSKLWHALTPQAFRADWLRKAHKRKTRQVATDDAQLVEALGHRVSVVEGSPRNLKITTPADIAMAQAWIRTL